MACLHVALKVRAVYQGLEVAAPAVLGVQTFPICTDCSKGSFVPDDFPVQEEVEVSSAALQVDAVHGLRPTRSEVNGLLLRCTGKFPAGNHKTLVSCILHQLAEIQ